MDTRTDARASRQPDDDLPRSGPDRERPGGTALLLMGGGARAAYSVGLLRCLARHLPEGYEFTAVAGISAGAINASYLASRPGSFAERVDGLARLWRDLEPTSVMRVGSLDLLRNVLLWGLQLTGGGARFLPTPRALVDCRPLRDLLQRVLEHEEDGAIRGIADRLADNGLEAVLVGTTSYTTGEAVVWSQGRPLPEEWSRAGRRSESTRLTLDHVMASAALPLVFPAVELDGEWHGDGDIRLSSPLSPLVALGVDRILAVSTHHGREPEDEDDVLSGYPTPGVVGTTVLNSSVLHHLETDARKLRRVNRLLELGGLEEAGAAGTGGFRPVELYILRPSLDLDEVAGAHESALPWALRWMLRGLGTHTTGTPGILSMISFESDYVAELMEAGEADAESHVDELASFLGMSPDRSPA